MRMPHILGADRGRGRGRHPAAGRRRGGKPAEVTTLSTTSGPPKSMPDGASNIKQSEQRNQDIVAASKYDSEVQVQKAPQQSGGRSAIMLGRYLENLNNLGQGQMNQPPQKKDKMKGGTRRRRRRRTRCSRRRKRYRGKRRRATRGGRAKRTKRRRPNRKSKRRRVTRRYFRWTKK